MSHLNEGTQDYYSAEPAITAIVVVPDTYDSVRHTMSHLQAQTAVRLIEVIFVGPSQRQLELDKTELACFHSWHVIEIARVASIARGFIAGIHNAHAPIVALIEHHSFPDSNWAELLIKAHQQPWAAVGPSMCNGNPDTILSWADFYQAYGEWTHPILSGPVHHLPSHNSSYKRDILFACKNQLEDLMEAESILHRHLKAQGYGLFLEARTCIYHLNFASWSSWIPARYYMGRQFASTWSRSWSWPRRLCFTVASPLIPWVRLWRIQRHIRQSQTTSLFMRLLLPLLGGLLIEGLGHMMGYATGAGDCSEKVARYEFHRIKITEQKAGAAK
jgi:hypothetical protein